MDTPTAKRYATHLHHLVVYLLQVANSVVFRSGLDHNQYSHVLKLRTALQDGQSTDELRMACLDGLLQSIVEREHSLSTKWNNPMECYFPIRFVHRDGSFTPAHAITSELAALKFVFRSTTLHFLNTQVLLVPPKASNGTSGATATDVMAR